MDNSVDCGGVTPMFNNCSPGWGVTPPLADFGVTPPGVFDGGPGVTPLDYPALGVFTGSNWESNSWDESYGYDNYDTSGNRWSSNNSWYNNNNNLDYGGNNYTSSTITNF